MNFKHGLSKDKFYKIWCAIHWRVKNNPYYKKIKIDPKWNDFKNFKKDMYQEYLIHKEKYSSTTIERIDNYGNYSKSNCRWATWQEQFKNQRHNKFITYNGEKDTISSWARRLKMDHTLLRHRIKKWGIKKAFEVPILDNKTRHTLKKLYK